MRSIARLTLAFVTAVATSFALPALAQDLPNRVGRIAYIEGGAAVYQDADEGWEQAYVNAPFTTENSVWTDPGSRAELRVGGTAMRLDEATQLDITRLDDGVLDVFVPRGTVSVRVRHFEKNERMIFNTPHARFSVRANGRYRVDVDPDREESRLTVFAGEARVGSDSGRVRVQAGKTVRVFGGSAPSYVVENAFGDPFDRWAETRDAGWVESNSVKYVSSSMTGYEDLDRYGSWREEPEFGALWFPTRVASDWAPYRHGRWDYVRPWGWTWVDDAPWGYAPFHYGRWVSVGDRWAWSPGRREVRPTWAPALVAWVGGSNFSVGVSSGSPSVGWYPLSPWERYQPWYNASPTYVNQVNIIVRESPQRNDRRAEWRDRTRERGVTVVNRDVVVDRRPVQQSLVSIRPDVARQVQIAAPATVLPSRTEVIQRRQTTRAAAPATTGAAPVTQRPGTAQTAPQRGDRAGPAARPEFKRQAAAPVAPEPAKAAPPPAQRVTAPTPAAQQQSREQVLKAREEQTKGREAERLKARDDQQKAGSDPAKGRQDEQAGRATEQKAREAKQQQALEEQRKAREEQAKGRGDQQKAAEEQRKARDEQVKGRGAEQQKAAEDQRKAREEQMKGREAEQQKAREQQQNAREEQAKAREAERMKARDEQVKGRGAEQQKAAEDQRKARDEQVKSRGAEQQKAAEDQRKAREEQMKGREAEQQKAREQQQKAGQDQAKARADQQKAAEEQRKAREAQQGQQQPKQQQQGAPAAADPQLTPQERAQQQRREREKQSREAKEKDDEEKKGKAGR